MLLVKICFHSPQHMFIKGIDPIHPRFAIDGMLLVLCRHGLGLLGICDMKQ
jgi:hypothetical protein